MALISTEQLKKIIETYLDESDINMDSDAYAALDKVSAVTGLMNKIAATFTNTPLSGFRPRTALSIYTIFRTTASER